MSEIRAILNRLIWHPREDPSKYEIIFIHRGAPGNLKSIPVWCVIKINPQSFEYNLGGECARIPFHRIVEIRNVESGDVIWRSRRYASTALFKDG